MDLTGTYTAAGLALLNQAASGGSVTITRIMAGAGTTADIASATVFPAQKQSLTLLNTIQKETAAVLPAVLTAALAEESYSFTELGVFAKGADEQELLFCVYQLDAPVAISPDSPLVLRFLLSCGIAEAENLHVTVSPAGLVTQADLLARLRSRNLLDNWDFRNPVNQRAVTDFTVGAYGIDRWKLVSGTASVTEHGIALNGTLRQIREFAVGGAATASVKTYSGSATATYDDTTKQFDIVSGGGTISCAKLELGSVATLENDPPADFAAELSKCQRYFERLEFQNIAPFNVALQMKATKRIAPSVSYVSPKGTAGKIGYLSGGAWVDMNAPTYLYTLPEAIFRDSSGYTSGTVYRFTALISADL
jgi:hypothetical protein